jgi:hypothetical protein
VTGDVLEQRPSALPAVNGAAAVRRAARRARAGGPGLLQMQDAFDLAQIGVYVLKDRRPLDEHLNPYVIADRHLVRKTTQVTLQLSEARRQLIPTPGQIQVAHSPKKLPVK